MKVEHIKIFTLTFALLIGSLTLVKQSLSQIIVDHSIYSILLEKYVKQGQVDYQGFKAEEEKLDQYLKLLEKTHSDNLEGGMLSWEGRTLKGFPKIQVFDKTKSPEELLLTAMDLEKGAWRFYTYILKNFAVDSIIPTLEQLSKAEIAHAKTVYGFWEKATSTPMAFDQLYESLKGEILEGGESLANSLAYLENIEENPCLRILELAIHMEYTAFDLYKTMAEREKDQMVRDSFLSIAQAEKSHMRMLVRALDQCV